MLKAKKIGARDTPVWTSEMQARSVRVSDLPAALQDKLRRGERGPQKLPVKEKISIRLSAEVLDALRATGTGWQSKADEVLRAWAKKQKKAA